MVASELRDTPRADRRDAEALARSIADLAHEPARDTTTVAILEAAARCLGRWGIAKTTVDDIAREAGVSRATVYRYFPGGRDHLVLAVAVYEEGRFYATLAPRLDATTTLADVLTLVLSEAVRYLRGHGVLETVVRHEPEKVLPALAFDRIGPLLYRTTAFLQPYLERHLPADEVGPVAEWVTRLVLSFWLEPSERIDPSTPDGARHLVTRYLLPGLPARPTAVP